MAITFNDWTNMFTSKIKAKSLLGIGLAACVGAISFQPNAKAQSLSKKLSVLSEIENKNFPVMAGRNVRIDSAFAGPGKVFGYNYTLVNHSAAQIDGAKFARSLHPLVVHHFCDSHLIGFFSENKVSMKVRIYDKHRSLVGRVKVSPSKCK